jgi:hypothetical protein
MARIFQNHTNMSPTLYPLPTLPCMSRKLHKHEPNSISIAPPPMREVQARAPHACSLHDAGGHAAHHAAAGATARLPAQDQRHEPGRPGVAPRRLAHQPQEPLRWSCRGGGVALPAALLEHTAQLERRAGRRHHR